MLVSGRKRQEMPKGSELRVLVKRLSTRRLLSLSEAELNMIFIIRRRSARLVVESKRRLT